MAKTHDCRQRDAVLQLADESRIGLDSVGGNRSGASTMRYLLGALLSLANATPLLAQGIGRALTPRVEMVIEGESLDLYGRDVYAFIHDAGGLVLADPRGLKLLLIDPGGASREVGRAGEGPGEFRNIRNTGPIEGGGFWVSDSRLLRFQVFDARGRFQRTYPYNQRLSLPPTAQFIQWPIALLSPSRVMMRAAFNAGDGGVLTRGRQAGDDALVVMDVDGGSPSAVVWRTEGERCKPTTGDRTVPLPFCISSLLDASPMGSTAVVVTDMSGQAIAGEVAVTVTRLSVHGETATVRIPTGDRRRVTEVERDSVRARAARQFQLVPAKRHLFDELLGAVTFHPSVDRLLVADDEVAWVGLPKDGGRTWVLVGSDGGIIGHLSLPLTEQPIAAKGASFWTARPDEDGFIDLRRYRVG